MTEVNAMSTTAFVERFGSVFEHSPWIANEAAAARPFSDRKALHAAMTRVLALSGGDRQLDLLRAHPDLSGRLTRERNLTRESASEQSALNTLTDQAADRLAQDNTTYRERFGFPFILCARLNDPQSILAKLENRLSNGEGEEITTALGEVAKIAWLRICDLVEERTGRLTTHVLDTARGCPASGVRIEVFRSGETNPLATAVTNVDGRTDCPLLETGELEAGTYVVNFDVSQYFTEGMLDVITIRFRVDDPTGNWHIPLLCSPWGYTTYRGS